MTHSTRSHVIDAGGIGALVLLLAAPVVLDGVAGQSPFSDFRQERPGVIHKIALADLPAPFATTAAENPPKLIPRPQGVVPQALPGYAVAQYADGLENPRLIRIAPNGDLFVAESKPG